MLQFMGSQRVRQDWATEQQQHCFLRCKGKCENVSVCVMAVSRHTNLFFILIWPFSEKAMAPHSSTLAWKICRLQWWACSWGC